MWGEEADRSLERFQAAQRKGVGWLLSHANPDGSIGPVEESLFYSRVPWALAVAGETALHSTNVVPAPVFSSARATFWATLRASAGATMERIRSVLRTSSS